MRLTALNMVRYRHTFRITTPEGESYTVSTIPDGVGIGVYQRLSPGINRFLGSLMRSNGDVQAPPGTINPALSCIRLVTVSHVWQGCVLPPCYTLEVLEGPDLMLKFLLIQNGVKSVADIPSQLNWDSIDDCAGFSVAIGKDENHEILGTVAEVAPMQPYENGWRITSLVDGNDRLVGGYETPAGFVKNRLTTIWRAGWFFTGTPLPTMRVRAASKNLSGAI